MHLKLSYEDCFDENFKKKGGIDAITTQELLDYFNISCSESFSKKEINKKNNFCLIP